MSDTRCRTVPEAIMRDLLIAALPYVEGAQDEPEASEAGKARARTLATNIRRTIEAMNG